MKTRKAMMGMLAVLWAAGCSESQPAPAAEATALPEQTTGAEAEPGSSAAEPAATAPAEPAGPAAATAVPKGPTMPTVGAIVQARIKDFDKWKTAFDGHEQARRDAGIIGHDVSRVDGKKNEVAVYVGATDLAALRAFMGSEDLKARMKESGVIGKPTITFLTHTEVKPSQDPSATASVNVTHEVADYAAWKPKFDAHADARAAAGVVGYGVSQDPENPNKVSVWLQGTDMEKLKAFTKDKGLKAAMKDAGVKGKPTFLFMNQVEMKFYQ